MNGFLVLLVVLGTTNVRETQQQRLIGSQGWKIAEHKDYFAPRTEGPTDYQNVESYTRDVGSTSTMAPNVKPEDIINPAAEEEPANFSESELKHELNKELTLGMAPNVDQSNIIKKTMVSSLPEESAVSKESEPPNKQRNNRDVSHILHHSSASMAPNKSPENFSSKAWDSGSTTMSDAPPGGTQPSVEIDEILTREVLQIIGGIATMAPNGQQEVLINQNTPIEPIEGKIHNLERVGRDISHILREIGRMAPNVKQEYVPTQISPDSGIEFNKTGTPSAIDLTNGESQKPPKFSTFIMAPNVQRDDPLTNLNEHPENNANKNKNSNSQNPERFGRDVSHLVVGVAPVAPNVEKEGISTQILPGTENEFNKAVTPNAEGLTNGESQKPPKFSTSIIAPDVQREDTPTKLNEHRENVIKKNTPLESKISNAKNPERFGRDVSHLVEGVAPVAPNVQKESILIQTSPDTGISFKKDGTPNVEDFAKDEFQKLPTASLSTMAPNVQQEDTLTDLSDHRENIINKNTPAESKNPNLQNIARFVRNVSHILEGSATLAPNVKKRSIPTQTSSDTGISFNKAKTVNAVDFAEDGSQKLPTASFSTMAPNVQQKDTLPKPSDLKRSGTQQKPIIFRDDQLPDTLISEVFNPKAPATSEIVKVQKSVQIQIPQTCMATFRSVRNAILRPKPISNLSLIQGVLNCLTDITEEELKEGHQHHTPEDVAEDVIRHSDFQYFLGEKHSRSQVEGRSNVGKEDTPKFLIDRKIDGIVKEDEEREGNENTPYFYDPQILPKDFPRRVTFEGPQFAFINKKEDEMREGEKQQISDEIKEIATNSGGAVNDLGHTLNSLLLEGHQESEKPSKDTAKDSSLSANFQDLDKPSDLRLCHESGEKLISPFEKSSDLHGEVGNTENGPSLPAEGVVLDVSPEATENGPSISTHRLARDVSHLFGNLKKSEDMPKISANGPLRTEDQPAVDLPYIFVSRLRDAQNLKVGENRPSILTQRPARDVSNWLAPKLRDILKAQGSSNFRSAGQTKIPALECGMSAPSADSHLKESMAENVASSTLSETGSSATPLRQVRDVSKLLASRLKRFRKTEDSPKAAPKPAQEDSRNSGTVMAVQPTDENISHLKYPDMAVIESGSSPSADRKTRDVSHLLQQDQNKFPQPRDHHSLGVYASKSIEMPNIVIVTPIPPLEDFDSLANGPSLPILPLDIESSILSEGPQISEFLELNRLLPPSLPENSEANGNDASTPIEYRAQDVATQPLADMPSSSAKLDAINSKTLPEDSQQFEKNIRDDHPFVKPQIKVDAKDLMELKGGAVIKPEVDTLSVGSQILENVEIKQLEEPSIPKNEKTIGNEHSMVTENPLQDVAPQNQNLNPESLVEIVQNIERKVRDISHLLKATSTVAPMDLENFSEVTTMRDRLETYSVGPQVPEYLEVNQLLPPSLPQNDETLVSNNSLSIENRTLDGATKETKKWPENSNNTESMESQAITLPNLKDNNMEMSTGLEKSLEEIENIMAIKREERDVSHLLGMLDSQMNLKVTITHSNPEHEALDPIDEHSRDIALLFGVDDTNNQEHGNVHQTGQRKSREVQTVGHIDALPLEMEPIAFNGGNEVSGPLEISADPENNIMDVLQRIQRSSGEKLAKLPIDIADQIVEDDPYVENILLKPVAKEYNFRAFHKKVKRSAELVPEDPMEIHSTPIPAKSEDMTTVTPDLPKSTIKSPRSKLPLTVFATRPKRFKDSQPKPVRKMPLHSTVNIIRPKKLRKPI